MDPGVYVFRNTAGEVIYVGKAKCLRKRLTTYFQPSRQRTADVKLRALIHSIDSYELFPVKSESEALLLESRFIKEYSPRYNSDMRDDKRFLHICIDPSEPYPRLLLTRLRKDDGRVYFGPFPRAGALRSTVVALSRHFRLRTCNVRRPGPETRRHCLERRVRSCCCPCSGEVTVEAYDERLEGALRTLQGETGPIIEALRADMRRLADAKRFEDAARVRDVIENLASVCVPAQRRFLNATLGTESRRPAAAAVADLGTALGLRVAPACIECVDISTIGGALAVGSLVCFRDGKPARRQYRRYRVRAVEAMDDTAMIRHVVLRRARRAVQAGAGLPDLLVIDGGRGQLNAAIEALEAAGAPPIPVIALAKKREEIHRPGHLDPLVLPRHHDGLRLLQALRDEAHRFAIAYHRDLRNRRIADSILAEIDGVGPERQRQLLRQFGSVRRLRRAAPQDIVAKVPGIGRELAGRIIEFLQRRDRPRHADAPNPPTPAPADSAPEPAAPGADAVA